ncbi:hypothetical protein [Actinokineospora globicatena]|uniref:Uncharacterized protein n=1 Tax=Actinokineospora globicatena TaxID=103729 RepID=A0A9W6V9M4_9PSEU|nr:hypothetical protein [Actinokineospora globicatena]GLW91191.1 hypothetical protein Aglo03_20070 [Actinokineospora globicatena]
MVLLPAVVPQLVEKRSELVPARLARKVAPLFGVPFERNPFRPLTWVCDFTAITVSEIARGAPLPTRADAARLRGTEHEGEWFVHDRAVLPGDRGALPNEIVAATVNRFGPDTKAAVVLTATNVLLAPATEAIRTALGMLRALDGGDLPQVQWIAAWAATAIEVYRSQPALVSAALTARVIQRASLAAPRFPLAPGIRGRPRARCEIGATIPESTVDPVTRPRDLGFLDGIAAARLNAAGTLPEVGTEEPTGIGAGVGDRLVEQLIGLLVDMGTPDGVAHIWVSERVAGQEQVWAMVPSSGLVRELVETWAHGRGSLPGASGGADALATAMAVPFRLPLPTELASVDLLARRAFVLAVMGIVRQMGLLAQSTWLAGEEFTDLVRGLDRLLDEAFDQDDPVVVDTRLRLAVQRAGAERHAGRSTPEAAAAVIAAADACVAAGAADRIDPGLLADLLAVACIELNSLRSTGLRRMGVGAALRRYWAAFAATVEVDLFEPGADHGGLSFQLHNYAAFLGANKDNAEDLRAALHLFTSSVIPGRSRLYNRDRDIRPLARSRYLAADAAAGLASLLTDSGEHAAAQQWARQAHTWVHQVLADPLYQPHHLRPELDDCLFALRVAPVLVLAIELGVADEPESDATTADALARLVERWLREATNGDIERSDHLPAVVDLRTRLTALGFPS